MNEILKEVQEFIKNNSIKDRENLEVLSNYIADKKQPFILAEENSVEYFIYARLQKISLFIDDCREELLKNKIDYIIADYSIKEYTKKLLEKNIDEALNVLILNEQDDKN